MSENYVNTEAIDNQAEELKATVGAICSAAEKMSTQCLDICSAATEYVQYNGYFDSDTQQTNEKEVTMGDKKTTMKENVCAKFVLSDGNISSKAQNLQQKANELSASMVVLKQDADLLKQVAAAIASNINSVNVALTSAYTRAHDGVSLYIAGEKFNLLAAGALAKKGVQKTNLTKNPEDIKNRNFLNYSDVKDDDIFKEPLIFKSQADGSYKIYTVSGKDTGYYTTFSAANNYQRTAKREMLKGDSDYLKQVYNNDKATIKSAAAQVATGSSLKAVMNSVDKKVTSNHTKEETSNHTTSEVPYTAVTKNGTTTVTTKLEHGKTEVKIYNNNSNYENTKIYDKDGNLLKSSTTYKNNANGLNSVTKDETTGEATAKYDPNKNNEGIIKKITKEDGTQEITYDPSKSYGKTNQVTNKDGSSTITYDSSKNEYGKTNQVNNKDGSFTATYDSSKNKDGIKGMVVNKDGSSTYTYDSSKNKDGIKGLVAKDGTKTITYDTNSKNNTHHIVSSVEDGTNITRTYQNGETYTHAIGPNPNKNGTYRAADGNIVYEKDKDGNTIEQLEME